MADLERSELLEFRSTTREWLSANAPQSIRGSGLNDLDGNWGGRNASFDPPEMKQWLADASAAHSRYAVVNKSQNETLKEKMAILGYLAEYISNQPRRYI